MGGIPSLIKYILKETGSDLIDGSQLTVTGRTLNENVADAADFDFDSQVRLLLFLVSKVVCVNTESLC